MDSSDEEYSDLPVRDSYPVKLILLADSIILNNGKILTGYRLNLHAVSTDQQYFFVADDSTIIVYHLIAFLKEIAIAPPNQVKSTLFDQTKQNQLLLLQNYLQYNYKSTLQPYITLPTNSMGMPINQIKTGNLGGKIPILISVDDSRQIFIFKTDDLSHPPIFFQNDLDNPWGCSISEFEFKIAISSNSFNISVWTFDENFFEKSKISEEQKKKFVHIPSLVSNEKIENIQGILKSEKSENNLTDLTGITDSNVKVLKGHKHNIPCVTFSPSGKYIVSASIDSSFRIWDIEKEKTICCAEFDKEWVWAVKCISKDSIAENFDMHIHKLYNSPQKKENFDEILNNDEFIIGSSQSYLFLMDFNLNTLAVNQLYLQNPRYPHLKRICFLEWLPEFSVLICGNQGFCFAEVMLLEKKPSNNLTTTNENENENSLTKNSNQNLNENENSLTTNSNYYYEFSSLTRIPHNREMIAPILGISVSKIDQCNDPSLLYYKIILFFQTQEVVVYEIHRDSLGFLDISESFDNSK